MLLMQLLLPLPVLLTPLLQLLQALLLLAVLLPLLLPLRALLLPLQMLVLRVLQHHGRRHSACQRQKPPSRMLRTPKLLSHRRM